jgi:hypothetical protein
MKTILRSLIALIIFLSAPKIHAQDFQSFIHDNYAGATGMFYNPASIADSRYKFDMEFIGLSNRLENNWVKLDNEFIFNWFRYQEADFKDKYLTMADNNQNKSALLGLEVRPLNFMFSYNEKNSFGFSTRLRAMANVDGIPHDAALLIFNGNDVDSLMKRHVFEDMSQVAVSWAEYGATWGRVLIDNKSDHFLKAGVTAKLLQGIGSVYLYEKYLEYDLRGSGYCNSCNG